MNRMGAEEKISLKYKIVFHQMWSKEKCTQSDGMLYQSNGACTGKVEHTVRWDRSCD